MNKDTLEHFKSIINLPVAGQRDGIPFPTNFTISNTVLTSLLINKEKYAHFSAPRQMLNQQTIFAYLAYRALYDDNFSILIISTDTSTRLELIKRIIRYIELSKESDYRINRAKRALKTSAKIFSPVKTIRSLIDDDSPMNYLPKYVFINNLEFVSPISKPTQLIEAYISRTLNYDGYQLISESVINDDFDISYYNESIFKPNGEVNCYITHIDDITQSGEPINSYLRRMKLVLDNDEDTYRREVLLERLSK